MIKSKKISSGLYQVVLPNGRIFEIEDNYQARADGEGFRNDWNLFEMKDAEADREYCQSYTSKRDAMKSIEAAANGEW